VADDLPVDAARDREILRIAQEALQNAVKHAHAHHVTVRLGADDGGLLLEVEDDGVGFDPAAPGARSRQLGLTSMEERAERLGGTLEIRSSRGAGTTVRLHTGRG
jgi:signal transduction histidine kinase